MRYSRAAMPPASLVRLAASGPAAGVGTWEAEGGVDPRVVQANLRLSRMQGVSLPVWAVNGRFGS